MNPQEFSLLRDIVKERSGFNLGQDKGELLEGRLRPLLKEFAFSSISALAAAAWRPESEYLRMRIAQAVTVQESHFFRDKAPFRFFADVILPTLIQARASSHRIRIWCTATATGQEPYSLAMLIEERSKELTGFEVEILATDFARDALARARKATYSQFEVQRGLPVSLLVKYFRQVGKAWQLTEQIRGRVVFAEHNLLSDAKELGSFDVIFCRNVLIYFDDETKRQVLAGLAARLVPDGYLVLGAAETTTGLNPDFMPAGEGCRSAFRLREGACPAVGDARGQATGTARRAR